MRRLTLFAFLLVGCQRAPSPDGAGAAPSTKSSSPAAAVSSFDDPHYSLAVGPIGSYKKGEAATFKVVVRTKGEFHINEEYPTKFAASTAPGVTYAMPKVARTTQPEVFALKPCASGKDNCTLELTVKFTPEQSGTVSVGGELSVGVCNKDNCLFEKKTLALSVPVS